ncbi:MULTISPECIES: hypothetical protein [Photobacterium]|nr:MULTISPECIES: hypothetical protein [Photobacterium]MDO6580526.1 hypothetical protein [Photobacterium sp. 2_MG-2023]
MTSTKKAFKKRIQEEAQQHLSRVRMKMLRQYSLPDKGQRKE